MKHTALMAIALLGASSVGSLAAFEQPVNTTATRRKPRVHPHYAGMTKEQLAWNAAVDAKRKAKKGPQ